MAPGPVPLAIDGVPVPVLLRRHPRSRKVTLRYDPAGGRISVSAPPRMAEATVRDFVAKHRDWIIARLDRRPAPRRVEPGATIAVLGRSLEIRHDPEIGRRVVDTGDALVAGGPAEHLAARVLDHLRRVARDAIAARARQHAATLGRPIAAITIRDPRSRWGSCSAGGRLSFSWRLVLAPPEIFDYVVAHEVAHLVEMNHSPRFWAVVARLHPEPGPARLWLRRHGAALHDLG
jgi:predicted metal-dependent hydrolase